MHAMTLKNKSINWQELAWTWGVPLFSLAAMAVLAMLDGNVALFYFMNRTLAHAGDVVWIHLSMVGDGKIAILFILPFLGRRPDVVWQFILAVLLVTLWVQGLKEIFSHDEWKDDPVHEKCQIDNDHEKADFLIVFVTIAEQLLMKHDSKINFMYEHKKDLIKWIL